MSGRKDRNWLRLGLTSSKVKYGREPVKRTPIRRWESGLAEEMASPLVSEDKEPIEVTEFTVKDLSSISSGEEAYGGLSEDSIGDEVAVKVLEFPVEELRLLLSREEAEEGSSDDDVGDEGEADDNRRSSGVEGST